MTDTGFFIGVGAFPCVRLVLDLIMLVALFKMPLMLYFYDIGLRYLLLPIISVGMGAVAKVAHVGSPEHA